jgi:ATP-dependent Clp protease ATP-binding subunit ClpX
MAAKMGIEAENSPQSGDSPVNAIDALLPGYMQPHEIKAHLDQFVVSQESAKTELSTLLSMHLLLAREPGRKFQTPNALLVGPTGVGKTYSVRTAADYLGLPFVNADATKLLPSGAYSDSGEHIDLLFAELLDAAQVIVRKMEADVRGAVAKVLRRDYGYGGRPDLKKVDDLLAVALAERGIIFLDEFDKMSLVATGRNVGWYRSVQAGLLKLVEGSGNPLGHVSGVPAIDTSGILFVAGGAFSGVGTNHDHASALPEKTFSFPVSADRLSSRNIVTYGFLPELIARFPVIIRYATLTRGDLQRILSFSAVDPMRAFVYYFEMNGKRLVVTDDALEAIAARAHELEMGARGIDQVIFPQLAKVAYSFFQQTGETVYELTADAVRRHALGG